MMELLWKRWFVGVLCITVFSLEFVRTPYYVTEVKWSMLKKTDCMRFECFLFEFRSSDADLKERLLSPPSYGANTVSATR